MDHVGRDEIESFRMEMEEMGRSIRSSFRRNSWSGSKRDHIGEDNEYTNEWAAIDRLPTFDRLRWSLFCKHDRDNGMGQVRQRQAVDVTKLGPVEMHIFIENLITHIENDNLRLLQKQKERIDRVNVKQPTIEIRYKNLRVEAECEVVDGKPLPTLWNSVKSFFSVARKLAGFKSQEAKISILKDVSGIIKPSRLTLLLGPPGCGKTTFLLALAGKLDKSLKVTGEVSYNGYRLEEFVPEKTAAYTSQYDLHIPEMTVRETMDFSARFQGVGSREEIMKEVVRREKEAGIIPDPEIDTYMKAISFEGLKRSLQTDYIMKILGLDICSDTMVGDAMRRGISGGQKKRLTTAEMIVGPTKALFMDEISTGLDSSTTYQIVKYLQQVAHISETTLLVSLLQPAPETYELFDDVILMAEGKVAYHGSRVHILDFFEECGFRCPGRKGAADFLQEVLSRKDQEQYWHSAEKTYNYVPIDHFAEKFKSYHIGQNLQKDLSESFDRSQYHKDALSFNVYSLPKWELFKVCIARELLLMRRNSFVYIFKTTQLMITACVTMTVFIRTRMGIDVLHSNYYLGALFYALILFMVNGFPELAMTVTRLPVFYKQRDLYFYPAWAYAIPNSILKIPISLIESLGWTSLTYYVIGYSPEVGRFFSQFLILFAVHQMSLSLFRFLAVLFSTIEKATASGTATLLLFFLFGGFILARPSLPDWLRWGFWLSPLTYGQIGVTVNEFLAPRWQKISSPNNTTVAHQLLTSRGLDYPRYYYWLSVGGLLGFVLLFNVGFTLALTYLKAMGRSRAIISREKLLQLQERESSSEKGESVGKESLQNTRQSRTRSLILPFKPLTISFENVQYYVDTPKEMNEQGYTEKRLQLLHDITGSFRPGILTALMGVSGAGKTTLMDVLSGRKTGGMIEGDIRIGGYPKVQDSFARISGYCEQTDIHSSQITVEESLVYSAWLRLPPEIDQSTRADFVSEVLETIELEGIKDALVGIPGISGLSTEQRKRLTIAVELVSNPSIIFMDEPTSGLDARAAAIVMRAVKNITATGRTVVCTIHQPSIDIFETFDELILMKLGGKLIYCGKMGQQSRAVIEYFQGIPGVPKIKESYNPATWMLEVTSANTEMLLGVDFAHLYRESLIYKDNLEFVRQLSTPPPDSRELHFSTRYPQNNWVQFKACLWKQYLSYWRNPTYNLIRLMFMTFVSVIFAATFWQRGRTLNNQQNLFNMLGSMFLAMTLTGINNCTSVLPFIARERDVLYREKFAGMYSSWAYSFAQMAIEIPFSFAQALTFMVIAYPAIGYYMTAFKFFWFFYTIYFTLLYFNYLGMFIVSITPNAQIASILASTFYTFMSIFAGFIVPGKQIPKWWIWFYYVIPTSWTLRGLFTSQYGDIKKEIMVFGEMKPIASFISDYFGFHKDQLPLVAAILLAYPLIYGSLFAYCIGKLNFQRR